jgi:tRNA A-37 threonylcarbamoyl transferase component Bud32/FixJ family two-component response regulator
MTAPPAAGQEPLRRLRVMIVDASREHSANLRRLLARVLPDVEVTEYDPEQKGRPPADFDWHLYDAVLLDFELGMGETGLDWLKTYARRTGFPPTVLMAAGGDDYLAARAIKLGACDYIRKSDIEDARLGALICDAVREARAADHFDATVREDRIASHMAILDRLHLPASLDGQSAPPGSIGYRFVRLIGQGSSSRVYLAERTTDATTLVLKVIDIRGVQDNQVIERFMREAEIVSAIRSPYVVHFYDYGLTQTYGYIAMEFFTRGDLKQRIEHGVAVNDALNYLRHIALGLHAIHAQGIVHRDLKPGNIMFRADDSLALADFGISKRLNQTSDLTNLGSVLGTPNYLSPEQALGQSADHRADLYSAGVILYEMLTGRKPYRAENASALVYQHVHADLPQLPEPLRRFQPLVARLLAKDCEDRVPTAAALVDALDRLIAA